MLFHLVLFSILLVFEGTKGFDKTDCEGNKHPGKWRCLKNEDNTLDVILDCNINVHKAPQLWLWSDKFPKNMKVLSIKNCETVVLDLHYRTDHLIKSFSRLQVSDTLSLVLTISQPDKNTRREHSTDDMEDFEEDEKHFEAEKVTSRLPSEVILKNIAYTVMESTPLISNDTVEFNDIKLEKLNIINTRIEKLGENFIGETSKLKELIMQDVTILKADKKAIIINNTEATIEISNSNLELFLEEFLNCNASKLIITGNKIMELSNDVFNCNVDEFVFSGNTVGIMLSSNSSKGVFNVNSPVININENTIDYIGGRLFREIRASTFKLKLKRTHTTFNFSSNEIFALASNSLDLPEKNAGNFFYDTVHIFNNSINCSCQNTPWISEMTEGRYKFGKDQFFNKWFKTVNQNKCSNIPNCNLGQVLSNYQELCEKDYQCPENVSEEEMVNFYRLNTWMKKVNTLKNIEAHLVEYNEKLVKIMSDRSGLTVSENVSESHQGIIVFLLVVIASCLLLSLVSKCKISSYFQAIGTIKFPYVGVRYERHITENANDCNSLLTRP